MPRRARAPKSSRAQGASLAPTPVQSATNTPCSSALPSAYPSEDEFDPEDSPRYISLRKLTLHDFSQKRKLAATAADAKSFRFLDLPSELRVKVYQHHFAGLDTVVDLHHENKKELHKKLGILRACRLVYSEASHYFYGHHTFRLFPTHPAGRYTKTKRPLLARLKPHQRARIPRLELRLGPGFNKPPRAWVVNGALGLRDCVNAKKLCVLVQLDPSASYLDGFRKADGFYEAFSCDLLFNILAEMPWLETVELDAWDGVAQGCPIMRGLLEIAMSGGRTICWGPRRGWKDGDLGHRGNTVSASSLMDGTTTSLVMVDS